MRQPITWRDQSLFMGRQNPSLEIDKQYPALIPPANPTDAPAIESGSSEADGGQGSMLVPKVALHVVGAAGENVRLL